MSYTIISTHRKKKHSRPKNQKTHKLINQKPKNQKLTSSFQKQKLEYHNIITNHSSLITHHSSSPAPPNPTYQSTNLFPLQKRPKSKIQI